MDKLRGQTMHDHAFDNMVVRTEDLKHLIKWRNDKWFNENFLCLVATYFKDSKVNEFLNNFNQLADDDIEEFVCFKDAQGMSCISYASQKNNSKFLDYIFNNTSRKVSF